MNALSQALKYVARIGVDYVAFENLEEVKKRRFTKNHTANRKISRFAKKQMLTHGVVKALKLGLNVILVDPKGTTSSEEHEKMMRIKGLDKHTASAYLVALRGLNSIDINRHEPA